MTKVSRDRIEICVQVAVGGLFYLIYLALGIEGITVVFVEWLIISQPLL